MNRIENAPAELWYRLSDQFPPYNAVVWLQWQGRVMKGCRLFDKRKARDVWAEEAADGTQKLDVRVGKDGLWRPQKPETWRLPLPDPVASSIVTGMTWIRQRMSAADAAALAEEMEAEREAARAEPDNPDADRWGRWWRKSGLEIKYEIPGSVSRRMAEGRIMRALADCGYGQSGNPWSGQLLDDLVLSVEDADVLRRLADIPEVEVIPRFRPLPGDAQDFSTAMGWLVAINPQAGVPYKWSWSQRVLYYRASDEMLSWSQVGIALIGIRAYERGKPAVSPDACRTLYEEAIDAIVRVANGGTAWPGRFMPDRMAQLRERNRAFARQR